MTVPLATILVIEDHLPTQDDLVRFLMAQRFHVITAINGLLGLEMAQTQTPDIIISDIDMPEMDGFQVIRQLRMHKNTQHIPIIFCSSTQDLTTQDLAKQMGAIAYLTKPLGENKLKQLLHLVNIHSLNISPLQSSQPLIVGEEKIA